MIGKRARKIERELVNWHIRFREHVQQYAPRAMIQPAGRSMPTGGGPASLRPKPMVAGTPHSQGRRTETLNRNTKPTSALLAGGSKRDGCLDGVCGCLLAVAVGRAIGTPPAPLPCAAAHAVGLWLFSRAASTPVTRPRPCAPVPPADLASRDSSAIPFVSDASIRHR